MQKERKKWIKWVMLAIIIIIILLLLRCCNKDNTPPWYDPNATTGTYDGKSEDEIRADLNRQIDENSMNGSIASVINFEDGAKQGTARIENIQANHFDQKVSITMKETGEVLYESGAIAPGQYIEKITLNKVLKKGSYDAIATISGFDRKSHEKIGQMAIETKIVVRN